MQEGRVDEVQDIGRQRWIARDDVGDRLVDEVVDCNASMISKYRRGEDGR